MRYIYVYVLFFLLSFNVYSQNQKKHFTFLEAGLNYSFLESDNYGDKNFTNGPTLVMLLPTV